VAEIIEYAETIGQKLANIGCFDSRFDEIAESVLQIQPAPASTLERIVEQMLLVPELPEQFHKLAAFGQPPVTLFAHENFIIEAYFWLKPETAIHDHAFNGAFTNLLGSSLSVTYEFVEADSLEERVRRGRLLQRGQELLGPGHVTRIESGQKFIHRIWHLSQPTVTLVIRTRRIPEPCRQWRYYPNGLSIESGWRVSETLRRQAAIFRTAFLSGLDAAKLLGPICQNRSDFERMYFIRTSLWDIASQPDALGFFTTNLRSDIFRQPFYSELFFSALAAERFESCVVWPEKEGPASMLRTAMALELSQFGSFAEQGASMNGSVRPQFA